MAQSNTYIEVQNATLNRERDQRRTVLLEAASLADTETLVYQRPTERGDTPEAAVPHTSVEIYTHDGGFTSTAAATAVTSDGDTIVLEFWDPDQPDINAVPNAHDYPNSVKYTEVVHSYSGLTAGAATPAQRAASLNADPNFAQWAYAAAAVAGANTVSIFPKGPRGRVRIGSGSTSVAAGLYPGSGYDNAQRTFTRVPPTLAADPWDVEYDAGERTLTITNNTAATVNRVTAVVSLF